MSTVVTLSQMCLPPPPSESPRYMMVFDINVGSTFSSIRTLLGFDISPVLASTNVDRSVGAKVSFVATNPMNQRDNIQRNDVVYKINGILVKSEMFLKIKALIEALCVQGGKIFIVLDRGSLAKEPPCPKLESILKIHNRVRKNIFNEKENKTHQMLVSFGTENECRVFEKEEEICCEQLPSDSLSMLSPNGSCDFSSVTSEGKILHSIFSPTVKDRNYSISSGEGDDSGVSVVEHEARSTESPYELCSFAVNGEEYKDPPQSMMKKVKPNYAASSIAPQCPLWHHQNHDSTWQKDNFSYSSASSSSDEYDANHSPVGLNLIKDSDRDSTVSSSSLTEDNKGKLHSRSKSFVSTPESELCEQILSEYSQKTRPQSVASHTYKPIDIPSIVFRHEEIYQKSERLDDCSVSTVFMSPLSVPSRHLFSLEELSKQLKDRDVLKEMLVSKVQTLQKNVETLETQLRDQLNESAVKIADLDKGKIIAEREVDRLKAVVVSSSKEAQKVCDALNVKQNEVDRLKLELDFQKESTLYLSQSMESLQTDLRAQITNLSQQLRIQEQNTASARHLADIELRKKLGSEIAQDKQLISELCIELKKANQELEVLTAENFKLSSRIVNLEAKLNQDNKQPTIAYRDVLKEVAAAEAAANAISKALVQSERELAKTLESQAQCEKLVLELKQEKATLERINEDLHDRLVIISSQLRSALLRADQLSATLNESAVEKDNIQRIKLEYESAKASYEIKSRELQSKLETLSSMVSYDEYQHVRMLCEKNEIAVHEKILAVQLLTSKVQSLEAQIEALEANANSPGEAMVTPSSYGTKMSDATSFGHPPSINSVFLPPQDRSDGSSESVVDSIHSESPSQTPSSTTKPLFKFSTSSRRDILRAAGGLAALDEKLKKTRDVNIMRSKQTESETVHKSKNNVPFRSPLAVIHSNSRSLSAMALRLASTPGKENMARS